MLRVPLQSELNNKAEEYRQVSLCLEDAMTRTNELKSQVDCSDYILQYFRNYLAWDYSD